MSRDALFFERLFVRRMPGIADGGFTLEGLSPGINIIHGPNASGKTTTARAIEALLWPRAAAPERASLAGRFRLRGESWSVDVDAGRVHYQHEGADAGAPALPPAESRDRYRLSLHELLQVDNRELALEILRESAGGYDLGRAADALEVRATASRCTAEVNALKAARRKLKEAEAKQAALRADESRLAELRRSAEAAEEAGRRVRLLDAALEHAAAAAEAQTARRELDAYPEALERLHGDEAERLDSLASKVDAAREQARRAEADLAAAEAALREVGFAEEGFEAHAAGSCGEEPETGTPGDGAPSEALHGDEGRMVGGEGRGAALPGKSISPHDLAALRNRIDELRELDRQIAAKEQERAAASARRDEERRTIGEAVDDARLATVDAVAIDELADFARAAWRIRAGVEAAEAEVRWLQDSGRGSRAPDANGAGWADASPGTASGAAGDASGAGSAGDAPEIERLDEGVKLLRRWLRSGEERGAGERRLRTLGVIAAALLSVVGVVAGLLATPLFTAALLGVVLLLLILRRSDATDPREVHRREYERLGLEAPATWSADAVGACLDRLERRLVEARLDGERSRRRAAAVERRRGLQPELDEVERRRAALIERFGVAPDSDAESLYWLANRISRWQDAQRQLSAAVAALDEARSRRAVAFGEARERIVGFGYGGLVTGERSGTEGGGGLGGGREGTEVRGQDYGTTAVADLAAAVDDLDRRLEAWREAHGAARDARRRLAEARARLDELDVERRTLLDRIGVADSDEAIITVRAWCERVDAYRAARERLTDAERRREDALRRLESLAGYVPELLSRDAVELERERDDAARAAAELESLRKEATEIDTLIRQAKESHDVEAALAEVERCRDALRDARERDRLAVVGNVLVEYVRQATRDQHRPEVFHRARERFFRITHGRYRLDFDDGDSPAFRAYDVTTGIGHALDELSSATRIQLLMAVRLAFVEEQEAGVRLPLLLDETLGNADDTRAEAIIDTVLALAAEGRQVFYFTAQPDEVGKWRGVLEGRGDVASSFIDLARVRRIARHREAALPVVAPPVAEVPPPDGATHEAYGRILEVPPIDPDGDVGGTHLWHLIDEPEALHRILRLRVETWGALRSLVENGARDVLGGDVLAYDRAAALARALETALEAARIGRGMPVDRAVLQDSGAVTDTFIDRVDDLCQACGGDASMLIEALMEGRVARFRTDARESLREYLEEHGYLDPRPPLDADTLRARTLATVADEIRSGLIDVGQVDRLLSTLAAAVSV